MTFLYNSLLKNSCALYVSSPRITFIKYDTLKGVMSRFLRYDLH